ncbi:hypothetical protein [Paludibacterium purpuratum]|uniref:Membrane protein DUF2157 n=1 Tax=Paludibacterium purpuratum TaxID=1144873 RepID=A0A4R7AZ35_9NEIS|nr:hypothetical protein [Paludibacterium purpuratum]TDR73520.1 hypothetical protein DFP86_11327 [Paludibacterium purpuratum]
MYSQEEIDSAIEAGVLNQETAQALREHVEGLRKLSNEDEPFRLIVGFNDVFVVIACLLLLGAVCVLGASLSPWVGAVATAGASWGLGECFVRRRRMALPAVVLSLAFLGAVAFLGGALLGAFAVVAFHAGKEGQTAATSLGMAIGAVLAAWWHWRRFRTPITVAAGTGAVLGVILFLLIPLIKDYWPVFLFVAGCGTFALAMAWDARDMARTGYQSDVAFWLHLLAAPLLVHPVFNLVGLMTATEIHVGQALAVLVLYLLIALCSLAIDRRALMVSALGYVLYTLSAWINQSRFISDSFALTALVMSTALLTLSMFWHPCRVAVMRLLPRWLARRLPA